MIQHFLQLKKERKNKKIKKLTLPTSRNGFEIPELSLIAPYFVSPPYQHSETINVTEHSKFSITLSAIGSPLPSLTWYLCENELKDDLNNYEIVSKPKSNTTHPTMMSTISFKCCSKNDLGSLQCVAANGIGIATFQVELNVQFQPEVSFMDMDNLEDGAIFIAGESLRIKAKFSGNPRPEICWFFNEDNEYEIITEDGLSILKIEELSRKNRGEYTIEAKNHLGLSKCSTLITVASRPNAPLDLNVEWTYSGVLISWLKPEDDGGSEIVKYTVDYYRKGWDLWLKLIDSNEEAVFVENLIENSNYKFRVKAENLYGTSDPSIETDWIYVTYSKKNNEEIDNNVQNDTYDFDIDSENTENDIDSDSSSRQTDTDLSDNIDNMESLNLSNNNDNNNNNNNSEYQIENGNSAEMANLRLWNNSVLICVCILILIILDDFYAALTLFILFIYYVVEQYFLQV